VEDLAAVLGILAGHDPRDGATSRRAVPDYAQQMRAPIAGTRIGIDERVVANAHPQIQQRLAAALEVLEKAGCKRVSVRFPDWSRLDQLVQIVQMTEVASAHAHFLRTRASEYGPQVRARFEPGHYLSAVDYQTALRARGTWLKRTLAETYAEADVAILPILPDPLPTIAELDVGDGPSLLAAMGRTVHFTRPVNYLGLPTLALALPRAGDEMPNGFQLIGRPFAEGRLLALGRAYQSTVPPEVARRLA
jgi:aspartyl-tRNA(Asn)/glutamyl-tRNA(Gln) amidotransferase subunit A